MICPYCGKEHPDTARYCPITGQPLSEQLVCPHCGEPVEAEWNYCEACHQPLRDTPNKPHKTISQKFRWLLIGVVILSGVFLVVSFWLLKDNIFRPKETLTVQVTNQKIESKRTSLTATGVSIAPQVTDQNILTETMDTTPTPNEVAV